MSIFLITFQVDNLDRRQPLIERIKNSGRWARIASTAWCIKSNSFSVNSLRDSLMRGLEDTDRLFVVDISNSNWGSYCLPNAVADWLKS